MSPAVSSSDDSSNDDNHGDDLSRYFTRDALSDDDASDESDMEHKRSRLHDECDTHLERIKGFEFHTHDRDAVVTKVDQTDLHQGEMRTTLDALLVLWLNRMQPVSEVLDDTHVLMLDFDGTKFQPQSVISFRLSNNYCWRGRQITNEMPGDPITVDGSHAKPAQHSSCTLHIHVTGERAYTTSLTCDIVNASPALERATFKPSLFDDTAQNLHDYHYRMMYDRQFKRTVDDVPFADLSRALFNTLQERHLVRDRLNGDLYKRKLHDGPFTFVKQLSVDDIVDQLYTYPADFGVSGHLSLAHVYALKTQIKTAPSLKSPFLEDFQDHFAFTNGLVDCKNNVFTSSETVTDKHILPRRFFNMSRVDAASMPTPSFDAFLTSQFGPQIPISLERHSIRSFFKYAMGSLLFRLQRLQGEKPTVYNLVVPGVFSSPQQRVLLALFRALSRPDGVQLQFTDPIKGASALKAYRFDMTVITAPTVDPSCRNLRPGESTLPFVFMTENPAPTIPHANIVDIVLDKECETFANDVSWVETEIPGIASQLIKAFQEGERPNTAK